MRRAKDRTIDALIAIGMGLVVMVVIGFVACGPNGNYEAAGAAVAPPFVATLVVAVFAAYRRERLRPAEMGVLILVFTGLLWFVSG